MRRRKPFCRRWYLLPIENVCDERFDMKKLLHESSTLVGMVRVKFTMMEDDDCAKDVAPVIGMRVRSIRLALKAVHDSRQGNEGKNGIRTSRPIPDPPRMMVSHEEYEPCHVSLSRFSPLCLDLVHYISPLSIFCPVVTSRLPSGFTSHTHMTTLRRSQRHRDHCPTRRQREACFCAMGQVREGESRRQNV